MFFHTFHLVSEWKESSIIVSSCTQDFDIASYLVCFVVWLLRKDIYIYIYTHTHTHEFLFQKYTAGVNKEKEKNKENCSSHHCSKRHSHYFVRCLETTRYSLNGRLCSNLVVLQSYLVLQLCLAILGKGEIKYLIKLFAVFLCVFVLCFLLNKKTWLIHYLKKSNVLEHLEQQ